MKKILKNLCVEATRKDEKEYWSLWLWEDDDNEIPRAKICVGEIGPLNLKKEEAEESIEPIDIYEYYKIKNRIEGRL